MPNRIADANSQYASEDDAFLQLQRLLLFINLRNEKDHMRLNRYCNRAMISAYTGGPWPMAYLRLQEAVLGTLGRHLSVLSSGTGSADKAGKGGKNAALSVLEDPAVLPSLETLCFLNELIPKEAATKSLLYYRNVAQLTREAFESSVPTSKRSPLPPLS